MSNKEVLLYPLVTEKSNLLSQEGRYTFIVAKNSSKIEIAKAVEKMFSVKVANVNVVYKPGKKRRTRYVTSKTPVKKKAIVTLKPGYKIDMVHNI